ncbi:hypothetical protein BDV98DRAFT_424620 [Pterulicium gracile]|uniref:Uncharacterized protein n=1 Tax=Pterulicium gracile TaxID=1884261 RepID=A0A5C3QLE7_9AGAR|nr:hypothetical protein BDV98DRAFT_424620 [Pterula gracilis]
MASPASPLNESCSSLKSCGSVQAGCLDTAIVDPCSAKAAGGTCSSHVINDLTSIDPQVTDLQQSTSHTPTLFPPNLDGLQEPAPSVASPPGTTASLNPAATSARQESSGPHTSSMIESSIQAQLDSSREEIIALQLQIEQRKFLKLLYDLGVLPSSHDATPRKVTSDVLAASIRAKAPTSEFWGQVYMEATDVKAQNDLNYQALINQVIDARQEEQRYEKTGRFWKHRARNGGVPSGAVTPSTSGLSSESLHLDKDRRASLQAYLQRRLAFQSFGSLESVPDSTTSEGLDSTLVGNMEGSTPATSEDSGLFQKQFLTVADQVPVSTSEHSVLSMILEDAELPILAAANEVEYQANLESFRKCLDHRFKLFGDPDAPHRLYTIMESSNEDSSVSPALSLYEPTMPSATKSLPQISSANFPPQSSSASTSASVSSPAIITFEKHQAEQPSHPASVALPAFSSGAHAQPSDSDKSNEGDCVVRHPMQVAHAVDSLQRICDSWPTSTTLSSRLSSGSVPAAESLTTLTSRSWTSSCTEVSRFDKALAVTPAQGKLLSIPASPNETSADLATSSSSLGPETLPKLDVDILHCDLEAELSPFLAGLPSFDTRPALPSMVRFGVDNTDLQVPQLPLPTSPAASAEPAPDQYTSKQRSSLTKRMSKVSQRFSLKRNISSRTPQL